MTDKPFKVSHILKPKMHLHFTATHPPSPFISPTTTEAENESRRKRSLKQMKIEADAAVAGGGAEE